MPGAACLVFRAGALNTLYTLYRRSRNGRDAPADEDPGRRGAPSGQADGAASRRTPAAHPEGGRASTRRESASFSRGSLAELPRKWPMRTTTMSWDGTTKTFWFPPPAA